MINKKILDFLQLNKLSELHNGQNVIFCKTDFLLEEFEKIKLIENDVTLISGNSDYTINQQLFELLPKNVKKWYAQNALIVNDIIRCIPIGIENKLPALREGHGVGWGDRVELKEKLIINQEIKEPTKFIYANFNINTNYSHRTFVKEICKKTEFIDWEEPNLTLEKFFNNILDYEAVVCAQGNGPGDNHRIYETLYMNRIPITFNKVMYENLHHLFPVVLIEDYKELTDYESIKNKIIIAKNKKWDKGSLEMSYWIKKILHGHN